MEALHLEHNFEGLSQTGKESIYASLKSYMNYCPHVQSLHLFRRAQLQVESLNELQSIRPIYCTVLKQLRWD